MSTFMASARECRRRHGRWHVIDADGQVLGRIATVAARLLQGKHKPTYTPFIDIGDHVVVVNAAKVKLTGRKEDQKIYRQHSGYEGGLREERARAGAAAASRTARRRSRARHAAEDEDGRGDVPEAEGVRRSGSSARGAETLQARGRVTWQQFSTTEQGGARHPPPACFFAPAPGPSASTIGRSSVLPHRSAPHADPPAAGAHRNRRQVRHPGHGGRRRRVGPGRRGAARHRARAGRIQHRAAQALKDEGLLTRDARAKERKKYGMAGARKRFQFSKR